MRHRITTMLICAGLLSMARPTACAAEPVALFNGRDLAGWTYQLDVENIDKRRQDRRHLNPTDDSEKPLGEWNDLEVTCRGNEVIVKVNGDLVNHATKCSQTKGAIALQSECTSIEFRKIMVRKLME